MHDPESAADPTELLGRFRRSYRNYPRLWRATDSVPAGVTLESPAERPPEQDLPDDLRRLLAAQGMEPPERVELLKHLRIVNGEPDLVVDDDDDLPPDDELVTLSQTVTLNSAEQVLVITDIFVARRR